MYTNLDVYITLFSCKFMILLFCPFLTSIELLIVYEIFQHTNLYDFCFEILLTTRLAKILMVKQRINCESYFSVAPFVFTVLRGTTLKKYSSVNFVEGALYNYACADALVLTGITTMMEIH